MDDYTLYRVSPVETKRQGNGIKKQKITVDLHFIIFIS